MMKKSPPSDKNDTTPKPPINKQRSSSLSEKSK